MWHLVDWFSYRTWDTSDRFDLWNERRVDQVVLKFRRDKDKFIQLVAFNNHSGRWYLQQPPSKPHYSRELKREIRKTYKLLPLMFSLENDNEQNQ